MAPPACVVACVPVEAWDETLHPRGQPGNAGQWAAKAAAADPPVHGPAPSIAQADADVLAAVVESIAVDGDQWSALWHHDQHGAWSPRNAATGLFCSGPLLLHLAAAAAKAAWSGNWWATESQWQSVGAAVKDSEEPTWGADDGHMTAFFHQSQVDGWDEPAADDDAQRFISAVDARVRYVGEVACYLQKTDTVLVPSRSSFRRIEESYPLVLHELVHWTGHRTRLRRRFGTTAVGDADYAYEEMVAELGAAILTSRLSVPNRSRPDHAAYVAAWHRLLGSSPGARRGAAGKAETAVGFLTAAADAGGYRAGC